MKRYLQIGIIMFGMIGTLSLLLHEIFEVNVNHLLSAFKIMKYFTVQSNLIAVGYFLLLFCFRKDEKSEKWKNFIGGVMIYTTITFLVFFIILEPLWVETGFLLVGSICLHYINPILIIIYTISNRSGLSVSLIDSFTWIIYPIIYLIFALVHGLITGDYLYPFFQITEIGIFIYMIVVFGLIILFCVLSFFVVKILSKK